MLYHAVPEAQQPDATTWVGGSRYHFRVFDREDELDYHFRPPAPRLACLGFAYTWLTELYAMPTASA